MRTTLTTAALACALIGGRPAAEDARPDPVTPAPAILAGTGVEEHRYTIVGRVRLLLFWTGHDGLGGARMVRRRDAHGTTLMFLVGSDPDRAPRRVNQWSYVREEIREADAFVFALGSVNDANAAPAAAAGAASGQSFSVSCAAMDAASVTNRQTTIHAPQATYWMFDRLIGAAERANGWNERRMPRPSGAAAGLLSAMQHVMRAARDGPRSLKLAPTTYVYQDAVYDLSIRHVEWLGRTKVGSRTFERLIRTDFLVRNRTTSEISRFGVTFSPEPGGPGLPVQIFYQPNFWLRIELRLDDAADVPPDPAADDAILMRMRAICPASAR